MNAYLRGSVALASVALLASACTGGDGTSGGAAEAKDPVRLTANVKPDAQRVPIDTRVTVEATGGDLGDVALKAADGKTIGGRAVDGTWTASALLEPGTTYKLVADGMGDDAQPGSLQQSFSTQDLTLDEQAYPSVAPLNGETVGVGMPVIVTFDKPIEDKASYEENMHVGTSNGVKGRWTWISDQVAHFRPRNFWPAGTKVHVKLDLNSMPAGNGIYGQQDQDLRFTVGSSMVSTVDVATHQLTVRKDGRTLRTIPVTTGDSSHQTRNGTKIIMEKFASVDMDAASTGVDADAPDYYNIRGVKWAMRLTNSGEFLHAAPWSVSSQGNANVSHGCTGMSDADANWLYSVSQRGDVVKYVNSSRSLEPQNGWTDWNVDWTSWLDGSALQEGSEPSPTAAPSSTPSSPTA